MTLTQDEQIAVIQYFGLDLDQVAGSTMTDRYEWTRDGHVVFFESTVAPRIPSDFPNQFVIRAGTTETDRVRRLGGDTTMPAPRVHHLEVFISDELLTNLRADG